MKEPLSLLAIKSKRMPAFLNYSLKIQLFKQIKKRLKIKILLVRLIKIKQSIALCLMFQGCNSSVLVGQNIRDVVTCIQYSKQQCTFSEHALSNQENRELKSVLCKYSFCCGCMITPDVTFLSSFYQVRTYVFKSYGVGVLCKYKNICTTEHMLLLHQEGCPSRHELKKEFKTVSPLRLSCK